MQDAECKMQNEAACHKTNKRLIYVNALKRAIRMESWKLETQIQLALDYIDIIIDEQPTVDAVILPCKIGDTIYVINKCSCYHLQEKGRRRCTGKVLIDDGSRGRKTRCGYISESKFELKHIAVFGKEVFLTRKEAEAALADMRCGGNEDV